MNKAWPNLLATLLCSAGAVLAQAPPISVKLPTVTPPSPTAQAFMRYGEIPVDPSTGVPNISIPIYTLGGKNMTVPITLSYHASGIKVNDVASEVGLGWVLNAGGMIARTVNGRPDERKSPIRTFANATQLMNRVQTDAHIWNPGNCYCLRGAMDLEEFFNGNFVDAEDYMSDRYFYKLPNGTSGVFTYDYSKMADDETSLVKLPYRPYRIEKFLSGPGGTIDSLRITDDNGVRYSYGYYYATYGVVSDWMLKRMVSADGTDVIKFKYIIQTGNYSTQTRAQTYYGPAKFGNGCSGSGVDPISRVTESFTSVSTNTPVLDEIISPEAIVKFTYGSRDDFTYLKRLTNITIAPVRTPTNPVKSIQFAYGYFGSTPADKRLRLNEVTVTAPGVTQPQKHTFTYESQSLPPYPMKMEYPTYSHPTYSEDFWGYYNGANSNYLFPREFILEPGDQQLFGGNRHADGNLAKACMLKEISYPTGGRTVFQFERAFGNIMPNGGGLYGGEYIGGFRVSSITNYDGPTGIANVKTYEYEWPVTRPIRKEDFWYDQRLNEVKGTVGPEGSQWQTSCWYKYTREMLFSSPLLPLEVAPGMPIMYMSVTEYNGTKTNNAGKTVYAYNPPYSPSDYYSWDHLSQYEMPFHYHPYHRDKGNYSPELVAKAEYAFDGTTYRPVSMVKNTYTQLYTQEFLTGIKLSRPERYQSTGYFVFSGCGAISCNTYPDEMAYIASVIALDTKAIQESSLLTKTKRYAFDQLDSSKYVLTTTDYTYNEPNLAVREQSTRASTGEVFKTTYKYPHDFATQAPYNHMVTAKHLWSPVIETSTYKNSTSTVPLESTKMRYDFWNGSTDQVYPAEVSVRPYNASAYESRVQYLGYDQQGNVLSVSKAGDVPTSYVWGYNGQHPIAEARNAAPAAIAYTSFERDSPGGWSYAPGSWYLFSNLVYTAARTGRVSYRLNGNGGVRRDNLPAGDYELSCWAQAATRPIVNHNGTLLADQQVAQAPGGWYQYRLRLRLGNGGFVNLDASLSTIMLLDEVRLHPVSAQLTSYTYDPLVGMTSQTTPNGRLTTYEYDELGRLVRTRDEQGRILSQQQYHYAGQP